MTSACGDEEDRAGDEAIGWIVALREEPDDAGLQARFQAWLGASDDHARAWAEATAMYRGIGDVPAAFVGLSGPDRSRALPWPRRRREQDPGPGRRPSLPTIGRQAAAAGLAASVLLAVTGPSLLLRMKADHLTGTAEQKSVMLDDGSRVELAPESAIQVAYSGKDRRVALLRGAAWFDVRHDPARPFRVAAKGVETTVLGTAFDVRIEGDGADVAVARGLVRVDYDRGGAPVAAKVPAGHAIRLSWDGSIASEDLPAEQVAAWRGGQLVVHDRPVGEVVDLIRPYFRGFIIARGGAIGRRRVTGIFDLRDPASALQALGRAHGASIRRITPWVIVFSEG